MFNPLIKLYRSVAQRGVKGTVIQLYMMGDLKFGILKGCDTFGNKYYEDTTLPYGQHRWVEYADIHNFDPTMIQPEWHGWMHHTADEIPGEVIKVEKRGDKGHTASNAPFRTNEYLSTLPPKPQINTSQFKQRGYKVGSLKTGPDEPDQYYKQPGHPLHPDAHKGGRFHDQYEGVKSTPN